MQYASTVRYHTGSEWNPKDSSLSGDPEVPAAQEYEHDHAIPSDQAKHGAYSNAMPLLLVREKTPNDGWVAGYSSFAGNCVGFRNAFSQVIQDGVSQGRPSNRAQNEHDPKQTFLDDLQGIPNPDQNVFRRRCVIAGVPQPLTKHVHPLPKSERQTSHFQEGSVTDQSPNWRIAA